MDFTREPIIETVITPKEGYRLVVRSSKSIGQEEFFVEAVEVVSFGNALFFRSTEKPKAFLVPTSDYEVLEVREARMALKHIGISRSIKIGGGKEPSKQREPTSKASISSMPIKETHKEPKEALILPADSPSKSVAEEHEEKSEDSSLHDRKRERRRAVRRRRQREELSTSPKRAKQILEQDFEKEDGEVIEEEEEREAEAQEQKGVATSLSPAILASLLPPPPNLIRETIARYRESEQFKGSFISDEKKVSEPFSAERKQKEQVVDESIKESDFQAEPCFEQVAEEPYVDDADQQHIKLPEETANHPHE